MKKRILIVGGTSGLGLELARYYHNDGHTVCITGRTNPDVTGLTFEWFNITDDSDALTKDIDRVIQAFPNINTLVYCAGFLQRGHIDALSDIDLKTMVNVGLLSPMLMVQRLKNCLSTPLKVMLVTSSSEYTPRESEPAYCATKSAMGMFGASLVRDMGIGKVLVVAPSGIKTPFWSGTNADTDTMLDPKWTADQIVELSSGAFKYKYARILREPARVEVREMLDQSLEPITDTSKTV